ncbi:MAG: response regulator, partial [Rhizobiales bacterium]|nr:response regulator [Hyphomicrobiales bacterium]
DRRQDGDRALCRQLGAWGGDVVTVSEPRDIPVTPGVQSYGQHALVFVDPGRSAGILREGLKSLERMISIGCNPILIGAQAKDDSIPYLARLPNPPSAQELFRAVHAALALPIDSGDKRVQRQRRWHQREARILLAEDNAVNRKVLAKMLTYGGYATTIVNDGEAMLDALENQSFDLVLFDLNMPTMDGLKAFQTYRFANCSDHPPFVALTADATEESRRRCLEAGIDDYLTKPIQLDALLEVVERRIAPDAVPDTTDRDQKVVRHPHFDSQLPIVDHGSLDRFARSIRVTTSCPRSCRTSSRTQSSWSSSSRSRSRPPTRRRFAIRRTRCAAVLPISARSGSSTSAWAGAASRRTRCARAAPPAFSG